MTAGNGAATHRSLRAVSDRRPSLRAKRSNPSSRKESWIASSQGLLAMTLPQFPKQTPRSRGAMRPSFARIVSPLCNQRAQGMPGAQCTRSLACSEKSIRVSHHGHTGTTRHSPRNGFTAYFALSSVTTLFDTVACASSHRLDANDWGVRTTRLRRTQQTAFVSRAAASTASRPAFVTIASRPSVGTGRCESVN